MTYEKNRSILIGCLLLALCACESDEERWIREGREKAQEINERVNRNKQRSEQLSKDMAEIERIMNGK